VSSIRTFPPAAQATEEVVRSKHGRTVSLCIPCRNEATTVGAIIDASRAELIEHHQLLDEIIVVDDRSTDATASVAAAAGATVVPIERIHRRHGIADGKGNALWSSLLASVGDVVVWCDGDLESFTPEWIVRLVAPLLATDDLALVKATYRRPTSAGGGGRTTELVARPVLSMLAPELTGLAQPLAGEFAGRRSVLDTLPFVCGWGVEIAMLLDVARLFGPAAIGQVDLGERRHGHQPLAALSVQAAEVLATVLCRTGRGPINEQLVLADGTSVALNLTERPPVGSLS
jgi:glucosyl-3-phosphoglycerate synthase